MVPSIVPLRLTLAHTEQAAVLVTEILVYPAGYELAVSARTRVNVQALGRFSSAASSDGVPSDFLRFGVQYSDGTKATNLGAGARLPGQEPHQPILRTLLVGGHPHGTDWRYWAWPLPPAGQISLICQWPALQIPETRADIDAEVILGAVDGCVDLWPAES
ncbi:Uncharacterised protein [Mycobacterium tuberculosis]|nr:Uncharacterised protein [Mycobacterium tuberculosis]